MYKSWIKFNQIKNPHSFIIKRDEYYSKLFISELENIINLYILDHKQLRNKPHIPVYAIMITYGERFFHPIFICALLIDLFGIQSRPGCSCARTYAQLLLGFNKVVESILILYAKKAGVRVISEDLINDNQKQR